MLFIDTSYDGFYFVSDERIYRKLITTESFGKHTAAQIFAKISASTRRRRFSPKFRGHGGGRGRGSGCGRVRVRGRGCGCGRKKFPWLTHT